MATGERRRYSTTQQHLQCDATVSNYTSTYDSSAARQCPATGLVCVSSYGSPGQALSLGVRRRHAGHRAGAGAGRQWEELAAQRPAPARPARPRRRAHGGTAAGLLSKWRRVVQRVGRVGRVPHARAVGAPLPARARRHLRGGLRGPLAASGGARGAGAAAGAPRHERPARASAGARQQERRAARTGRHTRRRSSGPGAHRGQAVAHLLVQRALGRRSARRRGVASAAAARAHVAADSSRLLLLYWNVICWTNKYFK